jgi:predicted nucleic acid-binding protein
MVASGNLTLCVDARVLSEYREVLERPKFGFDHDRIAAIIDYIEHHGRVVASTPLSHSLPDPDDEPFLEIAVSGGADYLVTGNAVHFPSKFCQGVRIVSPSDFLERGVKKRGRRS